MASRNTKRAAKAQNLADLKPKNYAIKVTSTVLSYSPKWFQMAKVTNILSRYEVDNAIYLPIAETVSKLALKGVKIRIQCVETGIETSFGFSADEVKFHDALKDAIMKCQFETDKSQYDASETSCAYAVAIFNKRNGIAIDATTGFRTRFDSADFKHQTDTVRKVKKLMSEVATVTAKETPLSKLREALEGKVKALGVSTTAGAVKGKSGK
jgi:hypothetical protein